MESGEHWMPLREFVAGLREELRAAHEDTRTGESSVEPRFVVGPVHVEFSLAAKREAGAKGGIRFYVLELGASGSVASESTQRVSMTLTPLTKDGTQYDVSDQISSSPE